MGRLCEVFPIWDALTEGEQSVLTAAAVHRLVPGGTLIHDGGEECLGLLVVSSGWLRAFIMSEEGREITLYRLGPGEICLFTGSCMLKEMQFDIAIEAGEDSAYWVIPAPVYKDLMEHSTTLALYTNRLMAKRFSEVMWLMEQVLFKRFDVRLATFLLSEYQRSGTSHLPLTHDQIARHLGTAREVVTRMLKNFQQEGWVKLSRGSVDIIDGQGLRSLCATP
ncbi:CRP/FNR family transcriptional regulator, anaerobic regulatory protein [Eubacterium aggregans]|uniref:CRP/FNR family transcriptional regulator, anaerobic regulatory protein n=1 Tax=Eubacterium aggregans TaxID=81409 RepID=A0A1H4AK38_9FIRM|nr:Crp/Fnr family transcriptional regulator [Eubacterium aggregans]SEA36286.1 CRP/FNR family transcriptional regulator, anaerobic regulatory protein [Eubacterium aggregans]